MYRYARPASVDEALDLLAEARWRIVAGGTDFYSAQGSKPLRDDVLDVGGIHALRRIEQMEDHLVIGAGATWTDIVRADLPPAFAALKQAAREVGSVQIQNRATAVGNLCNASPAADGVPPLLVLDAEIELASAAGRRHVPLAGFVLGNRRTALRPTEMVTAIRVPKASASGASAFVKLGGRRYLVISIAMVAARIVRDGGGRVERASVAAGACSPVAVRLPEVESILTGLRPDKVRAALAGIDLSGIAPIDDIRATAGYRREAARELIIRAVETAAGDVAGGRRPAAERAA